MAGDQGHSKANRHFQLVLAALVVAFPLRCQAASVTEAHEAAGTATNLPGPGASLGQPAFTGASPLRPSLSLQGDLAPSLATISPAPKAYLPAQAAIPRLASPVSAASPAALPATADQKQRQPVQGALSSLGVEAGRLAAAVGDQSAPLEGLDDAAGQMWLGHQAAKASGDPVLARDAVAWTPLARPEKTAGRAEPAISRNSPVAPARSRKLPGSISGLFYFNGPLALLANAVVLLTSGRPRFPNVGNAIFPLMMVGASVILAGAFWLSRYRLYPNLSRTAKRAYLAFFNTMRIGMAATAAGGAAWLIHQGLHSSDPFISAIITLWGALEVTHHFIFQLLPYESDSFKMRPTWDWRGGSMGRQLRKLKNRLDEGR